MQNSAKKSKKEIERLKLMRTNYESDNDWEIPIVKKNIIEDKNIKLISIANIKADKEDYRNVNKTVHFFTEDYRFNKVYNDYERYVSILANYRYLLTPDFSVFSDMPLPMQIYNVFRNRWCGAYWQDMGLIVIPTISWSTKKSYEFCFSGVEKGSVVAVSTLGNKMDKRQYLKGYNKMLEVINPSTIYCYDRPFKEMEGDIVYIDYLKSNGREK